jgi:hypothetical protein
MNGPSARFASARGSGRSGILATAARSFAMSL